METFYKKKETVEKLYSLHKKQMYRYALSIIRDFSMAEDIIQDAFCKMLEYIDFIESEDEKKLRAYLFVVTRTCTMDNLRKNKKWEDVTDSLENNVLYIEDGFGDPDFDIDKEIDAISFGGYIGELIEKLKDEDQLILYLRYGAEKSDDEIARVLGMNTADAVRKRLSRARSRLKNLFGSKERK